MSDLYAECLNTPDNEPCPCYQQAMNRIAELEQLLQKVVDDSEIGVVPRSHINAIEAALEGR